VVSSVTNLSMEPTPDNIGSAGVGDHKVCNFTCITDHKPDDASYKTETYSGTNVKVKVKLYLSLII
jgi:hypothetical protein